jgi:hypothetical protein
LISEYETGPTQEVKDMQQLEPETSPIAAKIRPLTPHADTFKLLLRRSQKSGLLGGKITFILDARVELSPDMQELIKKDKMGKEVLYEKIKIADPGSGLLGVASRLALKAVNLTITVDTLVKGQHIECKDILEMRAVEEQIKEACAVFKEVLNSAAQFDGEEVIDF